MVDYAELLEALGLVIAQRRKRLHMSQQELADVANVHRTYLSDVERGLRNLTLESLENIAKALETDCGRLLVLAREHAERSASSG